MVFELHLDTETVGHIDLPSPFCVAPEASVREVLEKMKEERRGSALICRDERLVGIFTERDALYLMASNGSIDRPIEEVMNTSPATIRPTENVQTAISRMARGGYRRLPVVDDENRLVGIISDRDLRRPEWVDEAPDISHMYNLEDDLTVKDLMSTNLVVAHTYESLHKVTRVLIEHRYGALPVLNKDGELVGILSATDLLQALEMLLDEQKQSKKG